jgi:DNA-binding MarR family transcriptional regulator
VDEGNISRLVGATPRLAYDDIVRHPHFAAARKVYVDNFVDLYDGNPFLVRLLVETGRFAVFLMTVVREASHDPARRETWLTIGRLQREMAAFGLASERHVGQLVDRLCEVGLIELRPSPCDRRIKTLHATETARGHDRAWLATSFAPLAISYPRHDYAPVLRRDPQFHRRYRRAGAPLLRLGARLMRAAPDMNLFFTYAGGYMLLAALLQAAMAGDQLNAALPYAHAGERFGVSRTQVRRLLVLAAEAGLVRLHARGGRRVEILPRLWASHDRALACRMYLHDLIYVAASKADGAPCSPDEHGDIRDLAFPDIGTRRLIQAARGCRGLDLRPSQSN